MTTPLTALERDLLACVERLVTACELRDARQATEHELELSEGRRREVETELEAREVELDRGMTH